MKIGLEHDITFCPPLSPLVCLVRWLCIFAWDLFFQITDDVVDQNNQPAPPDLKIMADSVVYCSMLLNLISGVGIIITNKYIVTKDAFNYVVLLSFCHYLFTTVFTKLLAKARFITPKHVVINKRATLAMVGTDSLLTPSLY